MMFVPRRPTREPVPDGGGSVDVDDGVADLERGAGSEVDLEQVPVEGVLDRVDRR